MFQRRHYEWIARTIKSAFPGPSYAEERYRAAHEFAKQLRQDNPRFDTARFLAACDTGD